MIDPQENRRSHLVPKWFEYPKAIGTGELIITRKNVLEINNETKRNIELDLQEFKANPTSEMACRLMGAGIIIGDDQLSRDMASFIKNKGELEPLSIELADKILNVNCDEEPLLELDFRISNLRKWVSAYPKSAIGWIELSRAFTIRGKKERAKKAALVALSIAPYDRYIVRCAVRLFLHTSDFDRAWYYIEKASKHRFDPWLKATEVNVALISERSVPNIKKIIPHDMSPHQLFEFSELIESAGHLELDSGNEKKAKKQFRIAWKNPSVNVITHAEWIIRNKLPAMKESSSLEFERSPEATTWINYSALKLDRAMDAVREWELEEPYSKYPFIVGSFIACNAGQPEVGVEIAKRGIQVNHRNKAIFNNLCYALLRAGNVLEADKYIHNLKQKDGTDSDMICLATLGLHAFRKKDVASGRKAYLHVINYFKAKRKSDLQAAAVLNLALAELEASTSESKEIAARSLKVTEKMKAPTIILLRKILQDKLRLM